MTCLKLSRENHLTSHSELILLLVYSIRKSKILLTEYVQLKLAVCSNIFSYICG